MTDLQFILTVVVPLLAAYFGAMVGRKSTLMAVEETYKKNITIQEENKKKIINNLLLAIHDEIEVLWNNYSSMVGAKIEQLKDGEALTFYFPIPQDTFLIYKANASLIGSIQDNELRKAIVLTYGNANSLIESIRLNNEFVQKYEYWDRFYVTNPSAAQAGIVPPILEDSFRVLKEYVSILKKRHEDVKNSVTNLLIKIKKNRIKYINEICTKM